MRGGMAPMMRGGGGAMPMPQRGANGGAAPSVLARPPQLIASIPDYGQVAFANNVHSEYTDFGAQQAQATETKYSYMPTKED